MDVLSGVKVLDLGSYITGPYAASLLGDLGAEVIKVESPGAGDPFRGAHDPKYSIEYQAHNRNKLSVTLDYRQPDGYEILMSLVAQADVAIVNSRPGVAARRGARRSLRCDRREGCRRRIRCDRA